MRRPANDIARFVFFLIAGLAVGLFWAWVLAPAQPTDTPPSRLNVRDRQLYIRLIADTFAATGDLARAEQRLDSLGSDSHQQLSDLIEADLVSDHVPLQTMRLAGLAVALGIRTPSVLMLAPPPLPEATAAIEESAINSAGAAAEQPDFRLASQLPLCIPGVSSGVIELTVFDEHGEPAPGMKVTVAWEGNEDTFFTGFDPSRSPGFADYDMMPGLTYSVAIDGSDPSVDGLQVASCPDGSEGGWQLEFRR